MSSSVEYYGIIDAEYTFVGLKSVMGSVARNAVSSLRRDGVRMGLWR